MRTKAYFFIQAVICVFTEFVQQACKTKQMVNIYKKN